MQIYFLGTIHTSNIALIDQLVCEINSFFNETHTADYANFMNFRD